LLATGITQNKLFFWLINADNKSAIAIASNLSITLVRSRSTFNTTTSAKRLRTALPLSASNSTAGCCCLSLALPPALLCPRGNRLPMSAISSVFYPARRVVRTENDGYWGVVKQVVSISGIFRPFNCCLRYFSTCSTPVSHLG
jgi:hypothetical protein